MMLPIRRILFSTDFSEYAAHARPLAFTSLKTLGRRSVCSTLSHLPRA